MAQPWRKTRHFVVRGGRQLSLAEAQEMPRAQTSPLADVFCDNEDTASLETDTTGTVLWDGAQALYDFLAHHLQALQLDLTHVVELGAGIGALVCEPCLFVEGLFTHH